MDHQQQSEAVRDEGEQERKAVVVCPEHGAFHQIVACPACHHALRKERDELQQRVRELEAQLATVRRDTLREAAEDERVLRELMEWADRCPNAVGKGYIRGQLLPTAKAMLDRWKAARADEQEPQR